MPAIAMQIRSDGMIVNPPSDIRSDRTVMPANDSGSGAPSGRRRPRQDEEETASLKRLVVAGPGREEMELSLYTAYTALAAQRTQLEEVQHLYDSMKAQKDDLEAHEKQMEIQFLADQNELHHLACNNLPQNRWALTKSQRNSVRESGTQLTSQGLLVERLNKLAVERTNEAIDLQARLNAASGRRVLVGRNTRASKLSLLRNTGDNQDLPLNPAPIHPSPASGNPSPPGNPSPSPPRVQDQSPDPVVHQLARDIAQLMNTGIKSKTKKKITIDLNKNAPVKPTDSIKTQCDALLRAITYQKFGVKQSLGFMGHIPVTLAEKQRSIVPQPGDYRWDFSPGFQTSKWNRTIIARLIDAMLDIDDLPAEVHSVDRRWMEASLIKKLGRYRADWHRLQPKIEDGRWETPVEAEERTLTYLKKVQVDSTTISAKSRKWASRIQIVTITIEIKQFEGIAQDIATWMRFLEMLQLLGKGGMSSEEEDEVETTDGKRYPIYKIKVCFWRNPELVDYLNLIDKELEKSKKRLSPGVKALPRVRVEETGKSEPVKGLPKVLYDAAWLKRVEDTPFYEDLEVSPEAFALFVAATDRMY
ncbi:hypothetical protein DFH06DRAFT_1126059 [Mycena polygramma]|nr:hypothetical protein DFH06DRAFT_1126059 [Mycena polygramma]